MATAINTYVSALTYLYRDNLTVQSHDLFLWGRNKWPSQVDFYRGEIASRLDTRPSFSDLENMYSIRDSFGMLSLSAGQPVTYPTIEYSPASFFNTEVLISSVESLTAAYSMALTSHGQYTTAKDVLDATGAENDSAVNQAYAYLYRRTRRWNDVLTYAQKLNTAVWVNPVNKETRKRSDGTLVRDKYYNALGALLAGEAFAYLGNDSDAINILTSVSESSYPYFASEAFVLLNYIARRQGERDTADEYLDQATDIVRTISTDRAESDKSLLLDTTTVERISQRQTYWDASTEPQQIFPDWVDEDKRQLIIDAHNELSKQVGMVDVKADILSLSKEIEYLQERKIRGYKTPPVSRHLIFTGPPGTGKTTMAHVVAQFYAGYGIVSEPKIVVATRSDLIGADEGSTAPKTQAVFDKARGGVLFIDEAPDMIQDRDGESDYRGQESISILLQNMENHRDDTAVILAGYEGGLQRFLATNEGLRSRFPRWIMFSTYTAVEIADIARAIADQRDNILTQEAHHAIVDTVSNIESSDFAGVKLVDKLGNGRFARNIVERAERFMVDRLHGSNFSQIDSVSLVTITESDVKNAMNELISSAL